MSLNTGRLDAPEPTASTPRRGAALPLTLLDAPSIGEQTRRLLALRYFEGGLGLLWFLNDGPLGLLGTLAFVKAMERSYQWQLWSHTLLLGEHAIALPVGQALLTLVLFAILFVLASGSQAIAVEFFWWFRGADVWGRKIELGEKIRIMLLQRLPASVLFMAWFVFASSIDVGDSAVGGYTVVYPLETIDSIRWGVMQVSIAQALIGSVIAQMGFHLAHRARKAYEREIGITR